MRRALPAVSIAAGLILTGCSDVATYQQRMDYLRKTTPRGVEAHQLLRSQGARIDAKRCEAVYRGLVSDIPAGSAVSHRGIAGPSCRSSERARGVACGPPYGVALLIAWVFELSSTSAPSRNP